MKYRKIGKLLAGIAAASLLLVGCGQKKESGMEAQATESAAATEEETAGSETAAEEETAGSETAAEEETAGSEEDVEEEGNKEAAADFEATLLSGETVKLSDYQGRKVLLNFWATWCGPCVGEMPALQQLCEEYPDELVVLAVNCGEDEKTVSQFIEKNGYTFPIALDTDLAIGNLYPGTSQGIPYTLLLDEEGKIMEESVGAADSDTMYAYYKENLGFE